MKMKFAIAGAAVAALALAGCSSSDDDDTEASASPSAEETAAEESGTIVDIAASNEDFETLVAAVTAADLVDTLSGPGPFTVFAPTDEAFEAVGQETLDLLLLESNKEALTTVLTYHVVADEILSVDIPEGETPVESVEGSELIVVNENDSITVEEANVIGADVVASNGVIHVIDAVLLPPTFDPAALATE
jgi:uncharacterized surface protein with fasciclin (FAS1) repeats